MRLQLVRWWLRDMRRIANRQAPSRYGGLYSQQSSRSRHIYLTGKAIIKSCPVLWADLRGK
jgi:hypothetical protein